MSWTDCTRWADQWSMSAGHWPGLSIDNKFIGPIPNVWCKRGLRLRQHCTRNEGRIYVFSIVIPRFTGIPFNADQGVAYGTSYNYTTESEITRERESERERCPPQSWQITQRGAYRVKSPSCWHATKIPGSASASLTPHMSIGITLYPDADTLIAL